MNGVESSPTIPGRRTLPPYPTGWYVLAFAAELPRGATLARTFAGTELVLFRTASGQACAVEAYCPHLGAHLGRGGRVEGEQLRCPFHGFRFDTGGHCVATAYGTKPPSGAKLRTWPLRERNGMLLAPLSADGNTPGWEVPALDSDGWSRPFYRRFVIAAHPQETTENSVDLGHFAVVHGYRSVEMPREVVTEGPYLSTAFTARRPAPVLGRLWPRLEVEFQYETHIYGLGYSLVEVRIRGLEIRSRLWVLPTPIDGERIALYLAASGFGGDDIHPWLRWLPGRLRAILIGRSLCLGLASDASQDFAIWESKRYVERPALAGGDGPIGRYRLWAAQFYETAAAETRTADAAAPRPASRPLMSLVERHASGAGTAD